MTAILALVLVLVVSAFVIAPLFGEVTTSAAVPATSGGELWTREKDVAVLAITEADFDRATGKLSDEDYGILRSDYENRALHAMDEIEKLESPEPKVESGSVRYCAGCGSPFSAPDAFCGSCGRRRFAA